ncbi:MAG TPA: hypothetical protein VHO73_02810 [Methylomirabilota bacterium]|nr:hypothetical protein [Methylomirabilota bacterium]
MLARLPGFLRRSIDAERAPEALACRLAKRDATFLDVVRRTIYARPASPYARLLRHAGCEPGDLERLVERDGVEGALAAILAAGVYLTVAELRGERPARRGSLILEVDAGQLGNPLIGWDLPMRTGGTGTAGLSFGWNLAFVRDRAVDLCLVEAAHGPGRRRHAMWTPPGSGAIVHLLDLCARGSAPARWFSPVDPAVTELPARYRWSVRLVREGGRLCGQRLPAPAHVPALAPDPVVDWMADTLATGATPRLHARPSAVLRACEAAARRGVALDGAEVTVDGEPITAPRALAMRRAGLRVLPRYAAAEVGLIGVACLTPRGPDDVHVLHDLVAVIQAPGPAAAGLPAGAFLVSSLRPTAPLILLNASMGDTGVLDDRPCGCPVSAPGWTTRARGIQRLDTLADEGPSLPFAAVARALDETLPRRFGGGPGDYQLVEDEAADGARRLRLLVHPAVGPVDPRAVAEAFVAGLEGWPSGRAPAVERHAPLATGVGKILHLHRTRDGRARRE